MMNNFLLPGLQDLCVSRTSFKWGIPVDFDDKHVVYVWIDALSNYITGLGFDLDGDSDELFKKYWPADIHLIGKDIIRFHTIYWPIMLMALGLELPKQVFGHPWLLMGDRKMSKSKGNVLYADDLVARFGVDAVRYFVLHEMPFENDGNITYELLIERINSDLANILGNLVNRTIAMTNKYFGGVIYDGGVAEDVDADLKRTAVDAYHEACEKMDALRVADAIDAVFTLLRRSNKYIDETQPWVLGRDETKKDRLATVLYNLLEAIRFAGVLLGPFLPETSEKMLDQINAKERDFASLETFGHYESPTKVTDKAKPLFMRLDAGKVLADLDKEDDKAEITMDDFGKIELKVGEVISCEKHPNADKLLVSQVDLGDETRQIVSGIAHSYTPAEMVGRKVIVVTNLKTAKLRGVESQGMILAGEKDGKVVLASCDLPKGTVVR